MIYKSKEILTITDLMQIDNLIHSTLTIKEAMEVISTNKNEKVLRAIIARLNKGETIESIFKDYLEKNIYQYFNGFIAYLSFKEALRLTLNIVNKEKQINQKIIKEITYPISLLLFCLIGIYLFNSYGFGPLINSISSMNSDLSYIIVFKDILNIIINGMMIIILLATVTLLYFMQKKRIVFAYILLQKHLPNSIIKEFLSSKFVMYFLECHKVGLNTKASIEVLKSIKLSPLISFLAYHVDNAFLKGQSIDEAMKNPYLDIRLSKMLKISIYSGNIEEILNSYLDEFDKRFYLFTSRSSKAISITSYVLIGIVIIFIYQILFIPLSSITSMI